MHWMLKKSYMAKPNQLPNCHEYNLHKNNMKESSFFPGKYLWSNKKKTNFSTFLVI